MSKESAGDRFMKSVFVGNIPHDASEEKLKELFSEFGPLMNVKFFKDNLSTYAFCEYGEQEMALRAIRNLSNYELKGRILKADLASSDKSKEEIESLQASNTSQIDVPQVADTSTEKAPEEISKAVASLPAEQMFELMKQMKMCIENNPQEARNLLLQNPQLAFALLQAQVIMRIVDPEVAMQVLNRPTTPEQEVKSVSEPPQQNVPTTSNLPEAPTGDQDFRQPQSMDLDMRPSVSSGDKDIMLHTTDSDMRNMGPGGPLMDKRLDPRFRAGDLRADPRSATVGNSRQMLGTDPRIGSSVDPRMMPNDPRMLSNSDPRMLSNTDHRMMSNTDPRMMSNADPRMVPGADPRMMSGVDPRTIPGADPRAVDPRAMPGADPRMIAGPETRGMSGMDPRVMSGSDPRVMPGADPRMMQGIGSRMIQGSDPRIMQASDPRSLPNVDPRGMPDPRTMPGTDIGSRIPPASNFAQRSSGNIDPRRTSATTTTTTSRMPANTRAPPVSAPTSSVAGSAPRQTPPATSTSSSIPEDEEKAALIMQVLQLSDEQIAQLPPEQRQSIIVLKEQIARSQLTL